MILSDVGVLHCRYLERPLIGTDSTVGIAELVRVEPARTKELCFVGPRAYPVGPWTALSEVSVFSDLRYLLQHGLGAL